MVQIQTEDVRFLSAEGATTIVGCVWRDVENPQPRAVVQLVHGMAEHIGRYDEFARYLVERGYVVCGHDHLGHGKSVAYKSEWGCLPLDGGANVLLQDMHQLRECVQSRYGGDIPYVVFGHSMGSFVVRNYIAQYGRGLAGAIVCGTGQLPAITSQAAGVLCRALAKIRGEKYRSKLIDSMGAGGYNKAIENPRTSVDWLSYNTDNVDAYVADERCGFMFSVGGYASVSSLTLAIVQPECIAAVPKDLPVLFIAGEEDPVGDCGKGVQAAYQALRDAHLQDVSIKLYPHMRHEILNEDDKAEVMADVYEWIEAHV